MVVLAVEVDPVAGASPSCLSTKRSVAQVKRRQDAHPDLFGDTLPDAAAERSRATMWYVVRFAESSIFGDCRRKRCGRVLSATPAHRCCQRRPARRTTRITRENDGLAMPPFVAALRGRQQRYPPGQRPPGHRHRGPATPGPRKTIEDVEPGPWAQHPAPLRLPRRHPAR